MDGGLVNCVLLVNVDVQFHIRRVTDIKNGTTGA
jgi:hypothetical protein